MFDDSFRKGPSGSFLFFRTLPLGKNCLGSRISNAGLGFCKKNIIRSSEEKMTRRIVVEMLLVCMLTASLFVSCASAKSTDEEMQVVSVEPEPVAEMQQETEDVELDGEGWLTALGSIKGLDIKGYRLRGEGPDGASFDWIDVTGTKVALSDIRRGQWTLYAEAIGENGDVLATGKLETFLSNSSPMGALFMDSEAGNGNARCSFAWNTFQVLYPSIEIYVKKGNGEYVARDASEISIGDGVAVWNARNIGAGSYIVRAILKDEGEVVAGVAAAMRVLDGKQSVGDVRFTVGKLSAIYGISLENSPVKTVVGSLVLEENQVGFSSDDENLHYDWFLNGEYVENNDRAKLDVPGKSCGRGFYRIDCIVQNSNNTSINSASMLVYCDGNAIKQVTEDEADHTKGDVPEGYDEITTGSEDTVVPFETERNEVVKEEALAEQEMDMTSYPAEDDIENDVESISEDIVENAEEADDDPIYFVYEETQQ